MKKKHATFPFFSDPGGGVACATRNFLLALLLAGVAFAEKSSALEELEERVDELQARVESLRSAIIKRSSN